MNKGFSPGVASAKLKNIKTQPQPISMPELEGGLLNYFDDVPDPRVDRTKHHLLKDILVIALLAIIAGGNGWEDMENYGISKQTWLKQFLELPNGIPHHDTFRRVFEKLDPKILEQKLTQWVQKFIGSVVDQVIPIDGKSLRGSYDRNQGKKNLHLVTAWASENRLVLGQVKVDSHSNEITAIPALLELIDVTGAIVTMDAMGTQTEIIKQIVHKKANYVVCLKSNHPTLYNQVKSWFEIQSIRQFYEVKMTDYRQVEKGHNRIEKRRTWAIPISEFGGLYNQDKWAGLQTVVIVERFRQEWNGTSHEVQFYLSSLTVDAQKHGSIIREHWSIENKEHWVLDVTFEEDKSRIRAFNSPRNLAVLRRMALNALNQETTLSRSLRQKRNRAAMSEEYMMLILKSLCQA